MILLISTGKQTTAYTVVFLFNKRFCLTTFLLVDAVVGAPRQDGYFGKVSGYRRITISDEVP